MSIDLTGLVLAGGHSSRMGRDKALMRYRGERLIDRSVRVLAPLCGEVVVASGDGRRLAGPGIDHVADAVPDRGPLGGLVAGLERAAHPLVVVVAVDMPDASAAVLRLLARLWDGEAAVLPRVGGRPQPLHAVWAASAAQALRGRLEADQLGLVAAARALEARVVEPDRWRAADPTGRFARNLNTPADLRR